MTSVRLSGESAIAIDVPSLTVISTPSVEVGDCEVWKAARAAEQAAAVTISDKAVARIETSLTRGNA